MSDSESSLLVALDVDRTLFDTSRFVEILYNQALRRGAKQSVIDTIRQKEQSSRGTSLDVVSLLADQKILPSIEELHPYAAEILYEGVAELISNLSHFKIPFVLLTYGSEMAQKYKISLIEHSLRRALPFHITSEPQKAAWLERIESNKMFAIELDNFDRSTLVAHSVILVDDKLGNLKTSHLQIHPILVDNTSSSELKDKRSIPIDRVWGVIQGYV